MSLLILGYKRYHGYSHTFFPLFVSLGSLGSLALGTSSTVRTLRLSVRNPELYKPHVSLEVVLPSPEGYRPAQKSDYILVRDPKPEPLLKTPPTVLTHRDYAIIEGFFSS